MAASVLLVHNARPAQAHHGVVWSATLTADESGTYFGCDDGDANQDDCSVALTDRDFTYNGATYLVDEFYWNSANDAMSFGVTKDGEGITGGEIKEELNSLRLNVGGTVLAVSDASLGGTEINWAYDPPTDWTDGQQVALSLIHPPDEAQVCPGDADSSLNPTDLRAFEGKRVLTLAWHNPNTDRDFGYAVRWRKGGTAAWLNPNGAVGEVVYQRPRYTHDITGLVDGATYDVQVRIVLVKTVSTVNGCSEWVSVTGTTQAATTPTTSFWSATLTVQDTGGSLGCDDSLLGTLDSASCRPTAALTDNTFTYGGVDYVLNRLLVTASGALDLELSKAIPQSLVESVVLRADDVVVSLSNGSIRTQNPASIEVPNSGLSWSAGDTISLSLQGPPPPTDITVTATGALREGGTSVNVFFTLDEPALAAGGATLGADVPAEDPPGDTLLTRYWVRWNPEVAQGAAVAVMQMYVPEDDDDNNCRERKYSVTFPPQVAGGAYLSADFSVTVVDNDGAADTGCTGQISGSGQSAQGVAAQAEPPDAELIAQMKAWRNDPQWAHQQAHTDRWDRALLAFGETVSDTSLTAMTAAEAQGYADRGWERWVDVAAALREIEAAGQPESQQQQRAEPEPQVETAQPQQPPNRAPELASAIGDVSGLEAGATREVALAGAFSDPDGDALTITAASGDESVATVEVAADDSALTVTGVAAGTATITVTAGDADGNSVSDTFEVSVVKAPEPEPEPEATEPSAVVARYDVNDNGAIDIAEYIQALRDRAAGRLGAAEWEEILSAWLASAYR